jgi:putative SOS response-associated peptidase YedK
MCAQFLIQASLRELEKFYGLDADLIEDFDWEERIVPSRLAPVIRENSDRKRTLGGLEFSLVPSWSKERKIKFATHNARVETIAEKPTWKVPFLRRRCLVPLKGFIEPIYEGSHKGNMVVFRAKSSHLLSAAGIWDCWHDKETGDKVESFAIVTKTPNEFVRKSGHDRMPIFLREEYFTQWLAGGKREAKELYNILEEGHQFELDLEVEVDRPLKSKETKEQLELL